MASCPMCRWKMCWPWLMRPANSGFERIRLNEMPKSKYLHFDIISLFPCKFSYPYHFPPHILVDRIVGCRVAWSDPTSTQPNHTVASGASGPTTRVGPGNGLPEGGLDGRRCLDRTELDTELGDGLRDCRRDARDNGLTAHQDGRLGDLD